MIFRLNDSYDFPEPSYAEPDGLLAIGGDLDPGRLINAYQLGIFPWYNENEPICWFSPHERCVIYPENFHRSKSMDKFLRKFKPSFTMDTAFVEVIRSCQIIERKDQDGTWINNDMVEAYTKLFKLGWAHSFEIWIDGQLAGGLYGVCINQVLCGESMFSKISNASKALMAWICQSKNYSLIDCQVPNPHLLSLGANLISRDEFMKILSEEK